MREVERNHFREMTGLLFLVIAAHNIADFGSNPFKKLLAVVIKACVEDLREGNAIEGVLWGLIAVRELTLEVCHDGLPLIAVLFDHPIDEIRDESIDLCGCVANNDLLEIRARL